MARTDAVQFFLELAAEWRRLGAEVTFEPGWERRGNGTSPAYEGGVVHHTAFLSSLTNPFPARNTLLNGRPDLSGPLCNVAGPVCPADRPRLHIIAAFPANHAGASGGRSMGPLPVSSLFNRLVVGLEIDYAGLTPMIGGQYTAALIFARGLANVLRRSTEYVRAHGETSISGKWDPGYAPGRTIDMAAFRRNAAAYQRGSDIVLDAETQKWLRDNIGWSAWATMPSGPDKGKRVVAGVQLRENYMRLQRMETAMAAQQAAIAALSSAVAGQRDDLTKDELKAFIHDAIDNAVIDVKVSVNDNVAEQAEA